MITNFIVTYSDEGPEKSSGQSKNITNPWCFLWFLENADQVAEIQEKIKDNSRKNPKITIHKMNNLSWSTNSNEGPYGNQHQSPPEVYKFE